ncbi:MAG: CinA family protein [Mailhella sp.]|nr:CinA family protein [Mailhella sp.]
MLDENDALVLGLAARLRERRMICATAESCTGGLIGAMLTAVPGSSEWYAGGVVSYANSVKEGVLGVSGTVLSSCGAVSSPVVEAMAEGVCRLVGADAACAVSGVAGPGGGTPGKPVGTVWIGWSVRGRTDSKCFHFPGDRAEVRRRTAEAAIAGLAERIGAAEDAPDSSE